MLFMNSGSGWPGRMKVEIDTLPSQDFSPTDARGTDTGEVAPTLEAYPSPEVAKNSCWKDEELDWKFREVSWRWKMQAWQAKRILISACIVGLLAMPAAAEIQSVTFKTSRKVGFL